MRVLILLFAFLLSFSTAYAKKAPQPTFTGTPFPIDEEFQTDFVGFDEKEFKAYEKEQKALAKLNKKRQKLEEKKIKLETKRKNSIENCERSQEYIEQLKSTDETQQIEENL